MKPHDPPTGYAARLGEIVRFAATGAGATAIHYAILVALVSAGLASPVVATTIGFAISAVFNYFVNARFTFRSDASHVSALPRFALVAGAGLALNAALMWLFHDALGAPYLLAQIGATGVTLVWNYLLNKHWTFSRPPSLEEA